MYDLAQALLIPYFQALSPRLQTGQHDLLWHVIVQSSIWLPTIRSLTTMVTHERAHSPLALGRSVIRLGPCAFWFDFL